MVEWNILLLGKAYLRLFPGLHQFASYFVLGERQHENDSQIDPKAWLYSVDTQWNAHNAALAAALT